MIVVLEGSTANVQVRNDVIINIQRDVISGIGKIAIYLKNGNGRSTNKDFIIEMIVHCLKRIDSHQCKTLW